MSGRALRIDQAGASYLEALLAVVVLAIALVPAMQALQTAFMGPTVQLEVLQWQQQLASRMEEMLAEPFSALADEAAAVADETIPTSYSDPAGVRDRMLVFLSAYDGDNADGNGNPFDGTDDGLIWVRVAIENSPYALTTLLAQ